MRTATLIIAAASTMSLGAAAMAQQPIPSPGASYAQPGPTAPRMVPQRPMGGWKPQPGAPRPGGWQPGRPGGARPGNPGNPGGWQPGKPGGVQPGRPGGWQPGNPGKPGGWQPGRPGGWQPGKPGGYNPGSRWGEKYKGRWQGGWRAPGGWGAYQRPVRGWTLPSYWISGGFWLSDWQNSGLSSPPYGYNWVRYYDDAVLVDRYGRVWDSVSGVDWDGAAYADDGDGYGADYDAPYDDDYDYDDADDRRDDRRARQRQPYPGGYAPPPAYAVPAAPRGCPQVCTSGYYAGQGYVAGGYYIIPPSTTVVVVGGGTTTTTTVTESVVERGATYVKRRVVSRAPTKLLRRTPSKQLYR